MTDRHLSAGDLRWRVRIERAEETRNAFNEPVRAWVAVASVWCSVWQMDGSARLLAERLGAGQIGATDLSRFTVRATAITRSVTIRDRLFFDGRPYNIQSIAEIMPGEALMIVAAVTP